MTIHKVQVLGLCRNNFQLSLLRKISGRYLTLHADLLVLYQNKNIP